MRPAEKQLASTIGRAAGKTPADDQQLRQMAAAAYHRRGVIVIWPETVRNDVTRMAIVQEADRQYGKRDDKAGN